MGWIQKLFGGGSPPKPTVSHVDQVLRRACAPGADAPCVATEEDGQIVTLYLQDAEQMSDDDWADLLTHERVRGSLRQLDLVLVHDGPKQVLSRVDFPALQRLVVGSLAHDVGDHAHTINNIGWGAQGTLPSIAKLAPVVEELVLRGVEGFADLPTTLRSLMWVSLASSHPDTLELGPDGTLSQLTELILIDAPSDPFATRSDLTQLKRLVVTPRGLKAWCETDLPALRQVEVLGRSGLDQADVDAVAALRERTGAEVAMYGDPEGIQIDDERGVSVRIDIDEHPLRGELEEPG